MPYRPKIKNSDGSLTDIPLEAETAVKLKTSRSIGLSGVTATAQSFNGTSAITIPVTDVPVSLVSGLLNKTYPVGAIYISTSTTSPAVFFGGSWTRLYDRFLLAGGSSYSTGSTGGSATHTLTVAEMPSHNHLANPYKDGTNYFVTYCSNVTTGSKLYSSGGKVEILASTKSSGGGGSHNNMPPYLAVCMWKRVE